MITFIKDRKHNVVKRDGSIEPYNPEKMYKVLLWAAEGQSAYVDDILSDLDIKVYDQIKIEKLFSEVIATSANKISPMFPFFDTIAKNLFLQKIYKDTWGIKRTDGAYPPYIDVLKKGTKYSIYSREIVESFSEEEIAELSAYIKPERDFNFDYLGLNIFMDKYSLKYAESKPLELPQHGFMRLALFSFWKEKDDRISLIKERYDHLSLFYYSEATPKWLNSLRDNAQMASCVVAASLDDSWSINKTISNLGLFSKWGGGLAYDASSLRASGSPIGKIGKSSGPVPFIKKLESTVQAYNQLGSRKGACVVYYNWWHYDVKELLMLKDEGGTEESRARGLQYGIKFNALFYKRFAIGATISLFDPAQTPELLSSFGEEFEKWYEHYENKKGIRKQTIPAQDLAFLFIEQRGATGNIYVFNTENVHNQTPFNEVINSSNLCNEIYLPSTGPKFIKNQLVTDEVTGETVASEVFEPGKIALCNLSSINILTWMELSESQKEAVAYNLLRASDNLLEYAYYPVLEGYISNRYYRPIGVGLTNLAQYFAKSGILFTDEAAKKEMFNISEDVYFHLIKQSVVLAKERGEFEWFSKTKWKDGWVPFEGKTLPYPLSHDWETLRKEILQYGVRFSTHGAIAPTATSALIMGSTEGVQPIKELVSDKTGTYSCKQVAPNLIQSRKFYQLAWEIPNSTHLELAAIRQLFLDQGQSTDLYYSTVDSASELMRDILYANKLNLKGLYYNNSRKLDDNHQACESCSA